MRFEKIQGCSSYPTKSLFVGYDEQGNEIELIVVFANTSREHPGTLDFVNDCDKYFGFHTIWIEGFFSNKKGQGTRFRITDYENAKRDGSVFREMVSVYGIPNKVFMHCTRELKTVPITKLVRSYGWKNKTYESFIGYRIDEPKRWKPEKKQKAKKQKKHIHFFVDEKPTTKLQTNGWWRFQKFNLSPEVDEINGNCDDCHKKNERKLIIRKARRINANEYPLLSPSLKYKEEVSDWWAEMEHEFGDFTPPSRKSCNPPYTFYRGNQSSLDLQNKARIFFKDAFGNETAMKVYEDALLNNSDPNQISVCEESCEAF